MSKEMALPVCAAVPSLTTEGFLMSATTYAGRNVAKTVGSFFIAGSGDAASGVSAQAKADVLEEIIQRFNSGADVEYKGQPIGQTDVLLAIAYARGKKRTKARRK